MGKHEKALWVALVVTLTVLELRMITWNDRDAEKNRQYAECLELQQFSNEIDTFTGDHSYLVLYYAPGQGFLLFSQRGDYSVFDAHARIADLDAPKTAQNLMGTTVDIGEVIKGRGAILSVPSELNEGKDRENLNVFFTARNGGWTEQLRTRRTKDGATYAIRVQGEFSDSKKSIIVCESVAKDFPTETLDKDFNSLPRNPKLPQCYP